jgi:hypothetical protein
MLAAFYILALGIFQKPNQRLKQKRGIIYLLVYNTQSMPVDWQIKADLERISGH